MGRLISRDLRQGPGIAVSLREVRVASSFRGRNRFGDLRSLPGSLVVDTVILTSADPKNETTTYAYDKAGNMLNQTKNGVTTQYSYAAYNRLSSIGKVNFTYDRNGNTHTIANGSTIWTYNYDCNNRLTQAQNNGVTVAQYSYDGNGMLMQSIEKSTQGLLLPRQQPNLRQEHRLRKLRGLLRQRDYCPTSYMRNRIPVRFWE